MCSNSGFLSEMDQNQLNFPGICDRCNDSRIYEPTGRTLDHQLSQPERPMFKFLKRLMRQPQQTSCGSTEEENSGMDTRGREGQLPRTQMNQNRPEPNSIRQQHRSTAARILCCLCRHGSEDSLRVDIERRRPPPELHRAYEDRIDRQPENISRQLDFSMAPSPPLCRNDHSKITFHREEDISAGMPAEILYSTDTGSSSRQSSDTEFFDAREYFSDNDSEKGSPRNSTLSRNASILKRCECMTCASTIRELGCPINYRIADVCDARCRERTRVRVNFDVRVAKYDIRSGNVMEEWIEELNLSEEVIPIGYLRNIDMEEEVDLRRRARSKLKRLFSADKRVSETDFGELYDDESVGNEGIDEFASFDCSGIVDRLEPCTTRNPGLR